MHPANAPRWQMTGLDALPGLVSEGRVLIFSAFDHPERVRRALSLGAAGYVRKDASPTELFRWIRAPARATPTS